MVACTYTSKLQHRGAECPALHPLLPRALNVREKLFPCILCGEQKEGGRWTCNQHKSKEHGGSCEYNVCNHCFERYAPIGGRLGGLCFDLEQLHPILRESEQKVVESLRQEISKANSDIKSVELLLDITETIYNILSDAIPSISSGLHVNTGQGGKYKNPLSSFDTPESLLLYVKDLVKHGKASTMAHGTVFVMGNTKAGKTSLVHTLKEYIKAPSDKPVPWLSQDHEQFLETKIMDIHSDIST